MGNLTNSQKSIWVTEQYYRGSSINNICGTAIIDEKVDFEKLEKSIEIVCQKHDNFWLKLTIENGEVKQVLSEQKEIKIDTIDVASPKELEKEREKIVRTPFKLENSELYKFYIFKFKNGEGAFMLNIHHLIADAWTLAFICNEIIKTYSALKQNKEIETKAIYSYIDYIKSEQEYLESEKYQKDKTYWEEQFTTIPEVATIPGSKKNADEMNPEGERKQFKLETKDVEKIKEYCKQNKISLYNFFMAIYAIYIGEISNLDEFVIGTPILNRTNFKEKNAAGMFINMAPFKINMSQDIDFKTFIRNIATDSIDMLKHQKYSYQCLLENLREKNKSLPKLYNILLSYQITNAQMSGGDVKYKTEWTSNGCCASDIEIQIYDLNDTGNLNIAYDYKKSKYIKKDIENLHFRIMNILSQIIANENIQLKDIEIVTHEEKNQILNEFNNTKSEYPRDKSIIELFEEQVEENPDKIAVIFENESLNYKELNEKANSLARYLQKQNINKEEIIGIFLDKSLEMIIAMIAILKSGAAYMPIDISYPSSRIEYMLENANCKIVLTKENNLPNELFGKFKTINISLNKKIYEEQDKDNLNYKVKNNNLAYVMYTSGSTGKPKGVMVEHKNIIRLVKNSNFIEFSPEDKMLQTGSIVFDACTFEIWGAILNGLELCIIKKEDLLSPIKLKEFITENKISIMWLTAPLFNKLCEDDVSIFDGLKYLLTGGDVLSPRHINKLKENNKKIKIINGYGPTENTTFSCCFTIDKNYRKSIPIGKPISNSTCYVVSKNGKLRPINIPGELWVGGDGVSRGYLNKEELTKEKFIKNHFGEGMLYKTGDLVKWDKDGNIEFLGRIDNQVKIRGFRVELNEINLKILEFEEIRESYTSIYTVNNQKYICSYVIFKNGNKEKELKNFLKKILPSYMVPTYIVEMKKFPLNSNGKIDKSELPKPVQESKNLIKPRNDIDKFLISTLKRILKIKTISIEDNFIEIGVDSLTAITLVAIVYEKYSVQVSVKDILNNLKISELSDYIQNLAENIETEKITKVKKQQYYPLSSAQKRIYYAHKMAGENNTVYNVPGGILVDKILDEERIKNTINEIITRHATLRTQFVMANDELVQEINENIELKIPVYRNTEKEIESILANFSKPFKLEKAPLMRAEIHFIDNKKTLLMVDFHHIIIDGTGLNNFISEFEKIYRGEKLKELPIQYVDYSFWENKMNKSSAIEKIEEYWINKFKDCEFSQLNLPYDYKISANREYKGSRISKTIDEKSFKAIEEYARKAGVSPYMLFVSAFFILLYKYTGQKDITVGTPTANRDKLETKEMIGMFVNNVVLRGKINSEDTACSFLNDMKEQILDDLSNQTYPFDMLVKKFGIKGDNSKNPLFDVMFIYQNQEENEIKDGKIIEINNQISKFNLSLEIKPKSHTINIEYCTNLFKKQTIERLFEHYMNVIDSIMVDSNVKIKDIEIISEKEKNKILYEFNDTKMDYPKEKTVSQLFEEQVEKTPDNIAVVFEDEKLTYRELNEKANQLANYLRNKGIKPNDIIGIMLPRSLELLISIIGVLKSGACYIPIDPTYPEKRIEYMLDNSQANLLITTNELYNNIKFENKICVNSEEILPPNEKNLENINSPEDMSYIIYTSGSTGLPKGVMLKHKSLSNLCAYLNNKVEFLKEECEYKNIASVTTASFDIFIFETLVCLQKGLKIILANEDEQRIPALLDKLIKKNDAQIIQMTPSRMQMFMDNIEDMPNLCNLKYVTLAGEALPLKLRDELIKLGVKKVYNGYGPSETTVFSTFTDVTNSKEINIGVPLGNTQAYILDSDLKIVPIGVAGELYIAGDGVGKGYLNREDITKERYTKNPFIENSIMYKTGDVCKYNAKGELYYLGRADNQVKIRGLRIELEEIENKILEFPFIKKAKVVKQVIGNREIISAYYVATRRIRISELRRHLIDTLPNYMVPSYFTALDAFPYTPNGKIDKNALPVPNGVLQNEKIEYIAPTTDLEVKLVSMWEEVLNTKPIGIKDNFFELGGDSILAMNLNIRLLKITDKIKYSDIFAYPTVAELSKKIQSGLEKNKQEDLSNLNDKYREILDKNMNLPQEIEIHQVNNVLLTGVTGYLGIHILEEFLKKEKGKIYVLIRKDPGSTVKEKLLGKMHYYFEGKYDRYIDDRIIIIEGDIAKDGFGLKQEELFKLGNSVDSIINSAAKVSHYGSYLEFYNTNVKSVEKIIDFANTFNKKIYHISTLSVSGNSFVDQYYVEQDFEKEVEFCENNLYIGQQLDNVYIRSKFEAEKRILDAILKGTDAYILRIGNLMPRLSDGKFQENIDENAYISRLKTFVKMGCIPDYLLNSYLEFTPIDSTAQAVLKIMQFSNKENRIYHVFNHNHVYIKDLIKIMSILNTKIEVIKNEEFKQKIKDILNSPKSDFLGTLINDLDKDLNLNYDSKIKLNSKHSIELLELYGFKWPKIDKKYIMNILKLIKGE